jgi:hypothetical protein
MIAAAAALVSSPLLVLDISAAALEQHRKA